MVDRYEPKYDGSMHSSKDGDWVEYEDYAALEAQLAERVRVESLRWKSRPTRPADIFCDTDVGQYSIGNIHGTTMVILRRVKKGQDDDEVLWEGLDNALAKAAAQSDFDSRILSALEATPRLPTKEEAPWKYDVPPRLATPPAPKVTEGEKLRDAASRIVPYLRWTISDESPGHHPTMPSAVGAFMTAFGWGTDEKWREYQRSTLTAALEASR